MGRSWIDASCRTFSVVLAICGMWMDFGSCRAIAGDGEEMRLALPNGPLPVGVRSSGIAIVIDPTWVETPGYRPVRMQISATPATYDRELRLDLLPNSWNRQFSPTTVVSIASIPAGVTAVSHTVMVPNPVDALRVEVSLDGRVLKDLTMSNGVQQANGFRFGARSSEVSLLLVDRDLNAVRLSDRRNIPWLDRHDLPDIRLLVAALVGGLSNATVGSAPYGVAYDVNGNPVPVPYPVANAGTQFGAADYIVAPYVDESYGDVSYPPLFQDAIGAGERLNERATMNGVDPAIAARIVRGLQVTPSAAVALRANAGAWLAKAAIWAGSLGNGDNEDPPTGTGSGILTNRAILGPLQSVESVHCIGPAELPSETVGLSAVDVMVISLQDLLALAGRQAGSGAALSAMPQFIFDNALTLSADEWTARERALVNHIRVGGTLVVYGVGEPLQRLAEIDTIMQAGDGDEPGWQRLLPSDLGRAFSPTAEYRERYAPDDDFAQKLAAGARRVQAKFNRQAEHIRWRGLGFGRIIAIGTERLDQIDITTWHWLLVSAGNGKIAGAERRDLDWGAGNWGFWRYAIPGTLQAPVGGFLFTIGFFVVLVGPINAFALRRMKRIYLLPATVMAISAATIIAMIAYAFLDDGITARSRHVSFSRVDQTARNVTSISRQNYYAAFAPSQGVEFPLSAEVFYVSQTDGSYQDMKGTKLAEYQDSERGSRFLRRDYLRSRTNSQFLVLQAQKSDLGLSFSRSGTGPQTGLTVVNQLGNALTHLWVVDDSGNLHFAADVPASQSTILDATDTKAYASAIRDVLARREAPMPPAFFGMVNASPTFGGVVPDGMLEQMLSGTEKFAERAQPRTYLAFCQFAPNTLPTGMKAREESSFHVIQGKW